VSEYFCTICKQDLYALDKRFNKHPFIDGRKYHAICWTCGNVPKNYEWDEEKEELTVFDEFDPKRLFTVDEMMSDGFGREESRISIRAVKASIRKSNARKKKSSSKKA
jgi:hypothetical protein